MNTINAIILEIRNDYENVFHITFKAQIPEGVALIRSALWQDPVINLLPRQSTEPLQLTATAIGDPALKVGDILAIQVFTTMKSFRRMAGLCHFRKSFRTSPTRYWPYLWLRAYRLQ